MVGGKVTFDCVLVLKEERPNSVCEHKVGLHLVRLAFLRLTQKKGAN